MKSLELFNLSGKVAIVTGAARGLGKQMALALAEAGADICVCDILEEEGQETGKQIEARGRRSFFQKVDVTQSGQIDTFVQEVMEQFGKIDILVNNAGPLSEGCAIEEVDNALWQNIIETGLSSMFYFSRAVGKKMITRDEGGCIINISSISGLIISKIFPRHNVAYGVAKAGVAHLTRGLASEWAQYNIRVNAIAPGYMLTLSTQLSRKYPGIAERLTEMTPMKRYGREDELNGIVIFLASEASSFMTGSILVIDGGNTVW